MDFDAGVAKGVVQLADGLAGTVAHPVQTAQGVTGLIDRAAQATPEGRTLELLFEAAYGKYGTPQELLAAFQDRTNPLSVAKAQVELAADLGRGMFAESIRLARGGKYEEAVGTALGQNVDRLFGAGMVGRGGKLRAAVEAAEEAGTAGRATSAAGKAAEATGRAADAAGDAARVGRGVEAEARAATEAAAARPAAVSATGGLEGTRAGGVTDKIAAGSRVDFGNIPTEHHWRYERYLDGPSVRRLGPDEWYEKARVVWQNNAGGNSFEQAVRRRLGVPVGRGSKPVSIGGFVPDLPVGARFGVTDVKDWIDLANTPQLDAFRRYALDHGLPFNLVIGPRTRTISAPLLDNVRHTGGRVTIFDPSTGRFTLVDIGRTGGWRR